MRPAFCTTIAITAILALCRGSVIAAAGGGLALLKTGDRVRIDLNRGTADILIADAELAQRRADLQKHGG